MLKYSILSFIFTVLYNVLGWPAFADGPAVPAGGAPITAAAPPSVSPLGGMFPFVLMIGVVYFLILRPQQRKAKEQQTMLAALKKDDEILTASGILGKIAGITDKVVTVEVADNVRVKMLKSQISQIITNKDKGQIKDLA